MESPHQQEAAGKNRTSTRWTPTTDQIRILKDLYYNNRVRSPSAEQIQRIAAKLRQFGKIEGKNVFYWFQNHKARERQKKRLFTPSDHHIASMQPPTLPPPSGPSVFHPDQMIHHHYHLLHHPHVSPVYRNFTSAIGNFPCGSSSYSSPSGGVMMNVGGYGSSSASASSSMATEKSFRECSIAPGGGSKGQQFTWIGVDPNSHSSSSCSSSSFCSCSPYPFLDKRKYSVMNSSSPDHQTLKMDELEEAEIETLPLFPMHGLQGDCIKHNHSSDCTNYYNGCQYRGQGDAAGFSRASLELALNSYAARFPKSP